MDDFDPTVLLSQSGVHKFSGHTGSLGIEFLEVGAGIGRMQGSRGYVPWPLTVVGVAASAVPLQASFHGKTAWELKSRRISLAEAFVTFKGDIVYAMICSSAPLKTLQEYRSVVKGVEALAKVAPSVGVVVDRLRSIGGGAPECPAAYFSARSRPCQRSATIDRHSFAIRAASRQPQEPRDAPRSPSAPASRRFPELFRRCRSARRFLPAWRD